MLSIVVMQERLATPSMCTVHAPHSAIPHPNFVPVMPSTSRSTQSSGVSPSTSTRCGCPLTPIVKAMMPSPSVRLESLSSQGHVVRTDVVVPVRMRLVTGAAWGRCVSVCLQRRWLNNAPRKPVHRQKAGLHWAEQLLLSHLPHRANQAYSKGQYGVDRVNARLI